MSAPVIILSSSPATCCGEPSGGVPMLICPERALASASSSARLFAGKDAFTVMTMGNVTTPATGAMSRMKLNLRSANNVALIALLADANSKV